MKAPKMSTRLKALSWQLAAEALVRSTTMRRFDGERWTRRTTPAEREAIFRHHIEVVAPALVTKARIIRRRKTRVM